MCGITGFWAQSQPGDGLASLKRMCAALAHRGPDDTGHWMDADAHMFLGHRRLSILDVSALGHQPMGSVCQRYQLVYNGEIYNHLALRAELEKAGRAPLWRGHSDSETILALITVFGFEQTLTRLNGMFAIAVWDRKHRQLLLARDRLGEKPLYYGLQRGVFLFGSELSALRQHPAWQGEIDSYALTAYLHRSSVPAPLSIYAGIHKLPPAHWICLSAPEQAHKTTQCYWSLEQVASAGIEASDVQTQSATGASATPYIDELEQRLQHSVQQRMLSDVPLGAFLSGGIDSSAVVAMMQHVSSRSVRSFSIGFAEAEFDEAPYAKAVAKHLGTEHTELYVDADEALELIPELPRMWDEPFADASQIPTYLVSRLARQSVTVCLSGDGGDELFYGYSRYEQTHKLWQSLQRYPQSLRQLLGKTAQHCALPLAQALLPITHGRAAPLHRQLVRAANAGPAIASASDDEMYQRFMSTLKTLPLSRSMSEARFATQLASSEHERDIHEQGNGDQNRNEQKTAGSVQPFANRLMKADMQGYLPNVILTKVDRASMAVGLEARAPFLDHELVEFAWRVPLSMKFRDNKSKWLLRQMLYRHVPEALVERPKQGFAVPVGQWLRGPLKDWAEALLDPSTLRAQGYLDVRAVQRMWQWHRDGKSDWTYQLWCVLMFQAWLESIKG